MSRTELVRKFFSKEYNKTDWDIHDLNRIKFSPNFELLLHMCEDKVKIWNTKTEKYTHTFPGEATSIAFSHDNSLLATFHNNCIKIWDIQSEKCKKITFTFWPTFATFSFSHDNRFLIGNFKAYINTNVAIWDIESGSILNNHWSLYTRCFLPTDSSIILYDTESAQITYEENIPKTWNLDRFATGRWVLFKLSHVLESDLMDYRLFSNIDKFIF